MAMIASKKFHRERMFWSPDTRTKRVSKLLSDKLLQPSNKFFQANAKTKTIQTSYNPLRDPLSSRWYCLKSWSCF